MSEFGVKNIFCHYFPKNFLKDIALPILITVGVAISVGYSQVESLILLRNLVDLCVTIFPSMLALILTAYVFLISFFHSEKIKKILITGDGKNLIEDLNASFVVCLFVPIISLLVAVIVSCCCSLKLECENPDVVNYTIYYVLFFLMAYSISVLLGVLVDLYNCGQTVFFD